MNPHNFELDISGSLYVRKCRFFTLLRKPLHTLQLVYEFGEFVMEISLKYKLHLLPLLLLLRFLGTSKSCCYCYFCYCYRCLFIVAAVLVAPTTAAFVLVVPATAAAFL